MSVRNNILTMFSALLIAAGAMVGCSDDDDALPVTTTGTTGAGGGGGGATTLNVYQVVTSMPEYSTLVAAVDKAGLAPTLQDANATLTVFAPNDAAFAALLATLGVTSIDDLTPEQLRPILLYHVLGIELDAAGLDVAAANDEKIEGLGGSIQFSELSSAVQLDQTAIVDMPDLDATNGIVHGINAVILPSITDVVVSDASFASLRETLITADTDPSDPQLLTMLDDDNATFTLFAPPNTAFDDLVTNLSDTPATGITALADFQPYQLLPVDRYLIVSGTALSQAQITTGAITTLGGTVDASTSMGVTTLDGATIVVANIFTSNGIMQIVDAVLIPSMTDVVTTAPEFSMLGAAIIAADSDANTTPKIAPTLDTAAPTGAYTLFAPNNAAFTALGTATPSGQALTNVLLYHVLNQVTPIYAADALALQTPTAFPTLLGAGAATLLTISSVNDTIVLTDTGSATDGEVTRTNYFTSNGVMQMINKVLIPQ